MARAGDVETFRTSSPSSSWPCQLEAPALVIGHGHRFLQAPECGVCHCTGATSRLDTVSQAQRHPALGLVPLVLGTTGPRSRPTTSGYRRRGTPGTWRTRDLRRRSRCVLRARRPPDTGRKRPEGRWAPRSGPPTRGSPRAFTVVLRLEDELTLLAHRDGGLAVVVDHLHQALEELQVADGGRLVDPRIAGLMQGTPIPSGCQFGDQLERVEILRCRQGSALLGWVVGAVAVANQGSIRPCP